MNIPSGYGKGVVVGMASSENPDFHCDVHKSK